MYYLYDSLKHKVKVGSSAASYVMWWVITLLGSSIPSLPNWLYMTLSSIPPTHSQPPKTMNISTSRLCYIWHHSSVLCLTETEHSSYNFPLAGFLRYGKFYVSSSGFWKGILNS